ncbi:16S rRNA (cytidine(1402)-2'-O)-methyltransferase [Verrucomicrobiaceae bacterium N1E253]|uniref:Ribosomal RNA small subunit methyltransferase I n=1 Tax=Oceaniferula marina TaxID=2748318 RepID=A0A851GP96_9BACT|nr:16S rRNA (cytidine(1402)-2'-O)-methyltransferase [Oceaniferula marina]NWK56847.1 16S rRNA (cytidine(1402)-2'-O)-methyltransferase [Oceaniferula marina]
MITFVPTPIGNRADITQRALSTLQDADLIACEDTRHSRPLLKHYEIDVPLISLHDHNEQQRIPEIVEKAQQGLNIAVISDAGTPLISDPGYRLVQACIEHQLEYTVLPGPSAVITALAGSGFPCHAFSFDGFLPVKKGKRRKALEAAIESGKTALFFESPHRLISTLEILSDIHPQLEVCVARELSKKFETYHRGSANDLWAQFKQRAPKGEIVLLINPASITS